ncbi:hypothetical protein [Phyllobacterium leguminum]|uniref:hypothetical protein n=1 Tax=Phyllobacterium leguminum TaxID=314237 RepID=UPI0011B78D95|nr:hypothetical protein [Phyllobacterium leguminum]
MAFVSGKIRMSGTEPDRNAPACYLGVLLAERHSQTEILSRTIFGSPLKNGLNRSETAGKAAYIPQRSY